MQLSSLEIKGFKSFGDKVIINFDEGITAIVGPNGCGKSNVVDAIRWVLGEQSTKSLRSEKMENIIFNGTKERKPSNLAEVSLTFNNTKNVLPTEYSTVTITRKLYRSGESEYRLNDIGCRLKDITDLFLDTGIGADSYSIIELKMVDEILNNKDNSRRNLFEEAAGISKYKIRKKQTFNKLKDTEADLSRVSDLLFELEGNLKTLESQVRKAEKYYRLKENYKQYSSQLASLRLAGLNKSLEQIDLEERNQGEQKMAVIADIDGLEAQLQEEKLKALNQEKALSQQQKATNEHIAKIRQYENDKKLKNERLNFLQEKEQRLKTELDNDKRGHDQISETFKNLESIKNSEDLKLKEAEEILSKVKVVLDELKKEQEERKKNLDQLATTFKEKETQSNKTEKDLEIARIQREAFLSELERTTNDDKAKKEELDGFTIAIQNVELKLSSKTKEITQKTEEEDQLKARQTQCEEDLQKAKDKLVSEHRILDAKQNEYNLTKSLVENLEGFPESIKFLKKNASWTKNAPLLSDILFCKEEYRIAIENYLEPYMNYYVVDNYREALQALNLLSNASKGRANFFILDSFNNNASTPTPLAPANTISALQIVELEEKYKKLGEYLLGKVFIIEQEEEKEINNEDIAQGLVILGKSGKFSKTKFSLSGGSVGLFEGKRIGRAKNLEVLEKEIKKIETSIFDLKNSIDQYQNKIQEYKEKSQARVIAGLQNEIILINNELATLKAKEEQYKSFIESNRTRKEDIELKITSCEAQIQELAPLLLQYQQAFEEVQILLEEAQKKYDEITDTVFHKTSEYNQKNIEFHQQQNKVSGISKDIEYRTAQIKSLAQRIEKNSNDYELNAKDIQELIATSNYNDNDLISMYEEKEAMEKAVAEAERAYVDIKEKINSLEDKINSGRRTKEQAEAYAASLKERRNEINMQLVSLKERLSVEFGIDINDLSDANGAADVEEEELKNRTEKTKNQLDNFGPINPLAVEAYQEMNTRYTFINEQKEDLIKAKQSLIETINEIDETAKVKFMESFTQIRDNFQRVFRSLFNEEDSCDLILVNPEDPLESDIDIIAKPKGKRPLTINQLSGGEKTLTATAILFSLYLLKPAPFCIFDEVDAPLDDTNIDKFNNIIRKFSNESQFIIVSHNKRTIASTDIVYGVTMVEQGVSRVVPVDLRKLEEKES